MRWPEFAWLTGALFKSDTRLRRHFAPPETPEPNDDPEEG